MSHNWNTKARNFFSSWSNFCYNLFSLSPETFTITPLALNLVSESLHVCRVKTSHMNNVFFADQFISTVVRWPRLAAGPCALLLLQAPHPCSTGRKKRVIRTFFLPSVESGTAEVSIVVSRLQRRCGGGVQIALRWWRLGLWGIWEREKRREKKRELRRREAGSGSPCAHGDGEFFLV
jgi:hypothetical protein